MWLFINNGLKMTVTNVTDQCWLGSDLLEYDQLEDINCKLPTVSILIKCVNNTDKVWIDELD